jgi:type III restriction enzyme
MGLKNVMVVNDEAHHCYQEKPVKLEETDDLKGDDKKEAEENNEAARLWINGIKAVQRQLGVNRVIDLSATPFFLRGSGYVEGTLFPWTMSDFSLMDAIECGIVKLPRVPVADNIPGAEVPIFRNLWENLKNAEPKLPRSGRSKGGDFDPLKLPTKLLTALSALYGHYEITYNLWQAEGIRVPPCFIVVCQNTAISKLVYDYISGFQPAANPDGTLPPPFMGALPLFSNYDTHGEPLARPRTLVGAETHRYRPDFILCVDDGHGPDDLLNLVVEIKGYRGEDAKDKKAAMETRWLPGVNNAKHHGRWAFAEFTDVYAMQKDFGDKVQAQFDAMLGKATQGADT